MMWYYVKDAARQGPVEEAEFSRLVGQSIVRPDTLVWCEGMADWRPYSTVALAAAPAAPAEIPVEPQAASPEPERAQEHVQAAAAAAPAARVYRDLWTRFLDLFRKSG